MTPTTSITYDGEAKSIKEWALDYGITPGIIIARLERGEPIDRAITAPMRTAYSGQRLPIFHAQQHSKGQRKQQKYAVPANLTFEDLTLTVGEWARRKCMPFQTLYARLRSGWSVDDALTRPLMKPHPGVSSDFAPVEGTGAGAVAQATPNITFSEDA